jgi:hypothetical protein
MILGDKPLISEVVLSQSITRLAWDLAMIESMEPTSLTLFGDLQLLLHPPLIPRVLQMQPLLLLLPVHLQQLPSHLVLLPIEARSKMFSYGASRPWYPCAAQMMLPFVGHTNRWVFDFPRLRGASARCARLWVLRPPSPSYFPLFLVQLWKTYGRGTTTPEVKTAKKMTAGLKKKTLSEDIAFPSLFLVFDAKGGEEDP